MISSTNQYIFIVHQRQRAVQCRSSPASSAGGALRSNGSGWRRIGSKDEEATLSPLPSSTTDDEESQSLRQSSGTTGGDRGYLRAAATGGAGGLTGRGPLKDSTVLLMPLEVGL